MLGDLAARDLFINIRKVAQPETKEKPLTKKKLDHDPRGLPGIFTLQLLRYFSALSYKVPSEKRRGLRRGISKCFLGVVFGERSFTVFVFLYRWSPNDCRTHLFRGRCLYHSGTKRYIINPETYSTCSQHVRFTFLIPQNSNGPCVFLLHGQVLG